MNKKSPEGALNNCNNDQKKRNGEIEVLRLFFTFSVLLFHSQYVSNGESYPLFHGGWLGVEFFFLVSGYLMAAYENRLCLPRETERIGSDTAQYVFHKARILYPYSVFAAVLNFFGWQLFKNGVFFSPLSSGELKFFVSGLLNFIFPYSLGFKDFYYWGYSWYLSAMIWGMMILFPLLRYKRNLFYCVIAPLLVGLGLGYYSWHYSMLGYIALDEYLFSAGLVRGIAELSMGCLCYKFSRKLQGLLTEAGKALLTMLEIFCLAVVAYRVIFYQVNGVLDYIIFFLIAAIVAIAFSEQSLLTFRISSRWSSFLGKFNLAVYLNSNAWSYMTARAWPEMGYWKATTIYICLTLAASLLCMTVCGGLQKLWKAALKDRIYQLFFTTGRSDDR